MLMELFIERESPAHHTVLLDLLHIEPSLILKPALKFNYMNSNALKFNMHESHDGAYGVSYHDTEEGEQGWTPVVGKQKRHGRVP